MEPKSDVPPAAPAEDNAWKAPGTSTSNGEAAPWASMLTVATAPESGHVAPFSDGGDVKRFPRTQSGSSAASPMHEFDTGPPAWSNSEFGSAASLTSPFDPSARTWASSSHSHLSRASSIHTSASTPAGKPDDAGSPLDAPQALSSNGGSYVDAAAVAGAPSSAGHPTPTSAAPAAATAGHPPGYAPLTSQVWGQPSVSTHRGVPTRWGAPDESRVSGSTSSRSSGSGSNASSTRWSSDTPNSSSTPTPHNGRPPVVPEATTWTPHGHDGSDGRPPTSWLHEQASFGGPAASGAASGGVSPPDAAGRDASWDTFVSSGAPPASSAGVVSSSAGVTGPTFSRAQQAATRSSQPPPAAVTAAPGHGYAVATGAPGPHQHQHQQWSSAGGPAAALGAYPGSGSDLYGHAQHPATAVVHSVPPTAAGGQSRWAAQLPRGAHAHAHAHAHQHQHQHQHHQRPHDAAGAPGAPQYGAQQYVRVHSYDERGPVYVLAHPSRGVHYAAVPGDDGGAGYAAAAAAAAQSHALDYARRAYGGYPAPPQQADPVVAAAVSGMAGMSIGGAVHGYTPGGGGGGPQAHRVVGGYPGMAAPVGVPQYAAPFGHPRHAAPPMAPTPPGQQAGMEGGHHRSFVAPPQPPQQQQQQQGQGQGQGQAIHGGGPATKGASEDGVGTVVIRLSEAPSDRSAEAGQAPGQLPNLIVNYLGEMTTAQLQELCAKFAHIVRCRVVLDGRTGRTRGFAFVRVATPEGAARLVDNLNGYRHSIGGVPKRLKVAYARPRAQSRRGGNVFVANLHAWVGADDLRSVASQYGSVVDCKVLTGTLRWRVAWRVVCGCACGRVSVALTNTCAVLRCPVPMHRCPRQVQGLRFCPLCVPARGTRSHRCVAQPARRDCPADARCVCARVCVWLWLWLWLATTASDSPLGCAPCAQATTCKCPESYC